MDMALSILDYVSQDLNNQPHAPEYYKRKVAAGELGVKSGKGFYDWSIKSADEVKARRDRFVLEFLRSQKAT
jgi:3-hydroxybutyryl-CoA dehydrogenase